MYEKIYVGDRPDPYALAMSIGFVLGAHGGLPRVDYDQQDWLIITWILHGGENEPFVLWRTLSYRNFQQLPVAEAKAFINELLQQLVAEANELGYHWEYKPLEHFPALLADYQAERN